MHIGVTGPANPAELADHLHPQKQPTLPGMPSGTPVNILVRALLDLGHQVTLATLDPKLSIGETLTLAGPNLIVEIGPYRPRHRARDFFSVERASVTEAFTRRGPNAISAQWSYEFALGAIESGIPTLVTVHDVPSQIFRHHPHPYRLVRWLMHRRVVARANRVAFNSPYTAKSLGISEGNAGSVLPNTIPDRDWILGSRDVPDPNAPLLVSVNHGFGVLKNAKKLLEAFSVILRNRPVARLQLIGSGFESDGLAHRWARRHHLAARVEFIGPLPHAETLQRIRRSDVLVHPSLEESFGYTLIEAASVGTPVIGGSRSGAVPWVLGHGKYGVLVDVRSPKSIAAAVLNLIDDPQRWSRLRVAAYEGNEARFATRVVAARYVDILECLAGRNSGP